MGGNPHEPRSEGTVGDGEGQLLQPIWREVERRTGDDGGARLPAHAHGPAADAAAPDGASRDAPPAPSPPVPDPASDATQPGDPEHARLLQSAHAVHALNERLQVDMDVPGHRLARDRMTAFVAKVSALSGVRPDELVIGSGSDAFVVQNDATGRTIARFDTQDAVNAPVGASLEGLAEISRRLASERAQQQAGDQQLPPKAPVLA